jgi:AbrB family looped-hinge helix DNA binding protein
MCLTRVSLAIELTRLSQKGQVVIPNAIRKQLGLREGTRFLVVGIGHSIVLRKLEMSEEKKRLRELLDESRRKAEKVGFTAKEIEQLIRKTRKAP